MKTALRWANRLTAALLALFSLYLIGRGASEIAATSGLVQGSEFGVLITLAHQIGGLRVWLGLFALWLLTHPMFLASREEK